MEEKLNQIVTYLISEGKYDMKVPTNLSELKYLYQALVNMRQPIPIDDSILQLEDEYLQQELSLKEITNVDELTQIQPNIILWEGDITTLQCDCIVNAGSNEGLGCFTPHHKCIDNIIHTNAGMRLRLECQDILNGKQIPNGEIIVCDGYNLPCQKIITTVGPQVMGKVIDQNKLDLAACYKNSLEYAIKHNYTSIAFPCISTGVFGYPIEEAKHIAYNAVKETIDHYKANIKVIFDTYNLDDYDEYERMLKQQ